MATRLTVPCVKSYFILTSATIRNLHAAVRTASKVVTRDKAFINGQWVAATGGDSFNVLNPGTGEMLGNVPDMTGADAQSAVQHAHNAFQTWGKATAKERSDVLKRLFELMTENKEELAKLITAENGKPLSEAMVEVNYASSFVDWYAEEGRRVKGDILSNPVSSKRIMVMKQPIGVCGMITPWNFPTAMITRKACAALAAGCTIVLKPSEETPYSALALAELSQRAGLPAGVFNVITCDRNNADVVGRVLCESPLVSAISFTGSSATGKILLQQSASTVKKCAMELGGNAPFIVFDSADVDAAVAGAISSKFRCSGQTCVCANRFFIQEGIYEAFVAKLSSAIDAQLKVGLGTEPDVTQGPLINKKAADKVDTFVQDALNKGATLVKGGTRAPMGDMFYEPTLLTGITTDMRCAQEEIFGPVIPVIKFKTEEEALKMANDVPAGLAGYVYTGDISQSWRVTEALDFGVVAVNEGLFHTCEAPFGGWKESGLGREGGVGYGIDEYLEVKYMCLGGIH